MKLRIRGNSIRLRLTQSEVRRFATGEEIAEEVTFGGDSPTFAYRLATSSGGVVRAAFDGRSINIEVPLAEAKSWADGEGVGIESLQSIGDGRSLRILIEKDYACLSSRRDEDEADMFANPSAGGVR